MDLTRIILGPVVTEKAERLKASEHHTYVLRVQPDVTKIDVRTALERYYGVEVASVRMQQVRAKTRLFGAGTTMEKRHAGKRALVTLTKDSKALDLVAFETRSAG